MSLLDSVRAYGRHRGKSVSELYIEIARLELAVDQARAETRQTAFELGVYVVAHNEAMHHAKRAEEAVQSLEADVDEARQRAKELRQELAPYRAKEANDNKVDVPPMFRDTRHPADQSTEPLRHIGDEFPDDYLDQRRRGWAPPVPLHQSPMAAVIPVEPIPPQPAPVVVAPHDASSVRDVDPTQLPLSALLLTEPRVTVSGGI